MEKDNWFVLGVALGMIAAFITSTILWTVSCFSDVERPIILLAFALRDIHREMLPRYH